MDESDQAFHNSHKPSWASDGTFAYAVATNDRMLQRGRERGHEQKDILKHKWTFVSEGKDIRFAKLTATSEVSWPRSDERMKGSNTDVNSFFQRPLQCNAPLQRFLW